MADELLQMFQSITTSDHDELVDQFAYLLQLDHDTATFFLESCNWNVELAVNHYLATMEAQQDSGGAARRADDSETLYEPRADDLDMEDDDDGGAQQQQQSEPSALFVSDLTQSQTTLFPPGAVVNMVRVYSTFSRVLSAFIPRASEDETDTEDVTSRYGVS